jgi:signal transduction histidine kinase
VTLLGTENASLRIRSGRDVEPLSDGGVSVSEASLRFSSEILKRLGEELNPNPDQGIVELAKNAYDADALKCDVELHDVSSPGGWIRIADNGDGMTLDQVRDGFLVLGHSQKDVHEETRLGRIPSGSKGLGRLAALRLGHQVEVKTLPRLEPKNSFSLRIDWDRFEHEELVEDVTLDIRPIARAKRKGPGTTIDLLDLRSKMTRPDVKRLARSLILLADPFGDDPSGFRPRLKSAEFTDLEKLVAARYFEDADFHLIAKVDAAGEVSARVLDWRGEELFTGDHKAISAGSRRGRPYEIPPTSFDLWVFRLSGTAFSGRTATVGEVREWLSAFGGVHLYVNGLRVAPYGNPGNDWLEMNLRRSASPEERPSTNTSLGRMSVDDESHLLQQKTDRSGLIEDAVYDDLRDFGRDAMDWLARRRLEQAEKRRSAARAKTKQESGVSKASVEKQIEKTPDPKRRKSLKQAFTRYDNSRQSEADRLRREVQLYRTLSTAGITAATFAHESASNPLKVIDQSALLIERRAKKALDGDYKKTLGAPIKRLKRAARAVGVLASVTLTLIDRDSRRVGRVELNQVIRNQLVTLRPFLDGRDVDVETNLADGEPFLQGTPAAVESIFTNLLNNALTALESSTSEQRRIVISTKLEDDLLVIRVLDNGPGIDESEISLRDIWLPGETTHDTGLGLTIVRDSVTDLGGSVEALAHGELGGAEFVVTLPILGS